MYIVGRKAENLETQTKQCSKAGSASCWFSAAKCLPVRCVMPHGGREVGAMWAVWVIDENGAWVDVWETRRAAEAMAAAMRHAGCIAEVLCPGQK